MITNPEKLLKDYDIIVTEDKKLLSLSGGWQYQSCIRASKQFFNDFIKNYNDKKILIDKKTVNLLQLDANSFIELYKLKFDNEDEKESWIENTYGLEYCELGFEGWINKVKSICKSMEFEPIEIENIQ